MRPSEGAGRLRDVLPLIAVAILTALSVGLRLPASPSLYDEGLAVVCSSRLLAGDVIYRDFSSHYGPLAPLLGAIAMALAPRSWIATRVGFMPVPVAAAVLVTCLATRLSRDRRVGLAVGLLLAVDLGGLAWGSSLILAVTLVLGSFLALARSFDEGARSARDLGVAGFLLGLASLARHDVALLGLLPLLGLAILRADGRRPGSAPSALWFVGTAVVPPALALLALSRAGAIGAAWKDLVVVPSGEYRQARAIPWPLPLREPMSVVLAVNGAPFIALLGLVSIEWRVLRATPRTWLTALRAHAGPVALPLAASGLTLLLTGIAAVRSDARHIASARLSAFAVVASLARAPLGRARAVGLAVALLVLAHGIGLSAVDAFEWIGSIARAESFAAMPPRQGLFAGSGIDADRRRAIELVSERPPGSRIWVGLVRHDSTWASDAAFYFDADALPAGRLHGLEPWCVLEKYQREIVADLEATRPPRIVLVSARFPRDPAAEAVGPVSRVLDTYLGTRYELVESVGPYVVLRPRS